MEATKPRRSRAAMIYEASIKRLSSKEKLELIGLITTDMAEEVSDNKRLHDPMEFAGFAKDNPIGIDASKYIKAMRAEWDEQ